MKTIYGPAKTLFTLFLMYSGLCCAQGSTNTQNPVSIDVARTLSWLPVDTETIIVADVHKRSFLTSKTFEALKQDNNTNPVLKVDEVAAVFEAGPLWLLTTRKELAKLVDQHQIVLAIEGSRHFRAPTGLGEMTFEGCEMVVFTDNLGKREDLLRQFSKGARRQEMIEGQTVNVFEEKMEQDSWTMYLAFPESKVLLIGTNRDYVQQVLQRIKSPSPERALPESLPEWKYVNTEAPFWGLRHYDRSQAQFDPSSPFGGPKAANAPDERAIGLVFHFDPSEGRVARVTYISGDSRNAGMIGKAFLGNTEADARDLRVSARSVDAGGIELSFQLSKADSVSYFFFILQGLLGHAVYL